MKFSNMLKIYEYIREDSDQLEDKMDDLRTEMKDLETKIRDAQDIAMANMLQHELDGLEANYRAVLREHGKLMYMLDSINDAELQ